jgi:hypothetical protein
MRYWGYLAAKLLAIAAIAYCGIAFISYAWPVDVALQGAKPFATDLGYTFTMLGWFLFCTGLFYLAMLDTRYRCRTCLRRLRMPITTGSWSHVLLGPSKMEYICPFGHGTLKVPEIQITGPHPPDWEKHGDIWKELFSTEETNK